MQAKIILASIAAVILTYNPSVAQEMKCAILEAEAPALDAELVRLKAIVNEIKDPSGQDIVKFCQVLTGFQALNMATANVYRKCAVTSDTTGFYNDLATGQEQEAIQVYGRNASALNCRYIK